MCAHYLFDTDFCNVASGWEKGVVEKNVQDSRRRIWLDAQKIQWASFAELNAWLGERCRALWSEVAHPEFKAFSVLEMLEQERGEMMPMTTAFDGYVEKSARVSSTCLVTVARNRYSVPCELANARVSTRLYPNRVDIATADAVVASHERLADRGHIRYDWQHYIALVQRKPGALRNGAPFADLPGPLQRLRQGLMRHDGGDKVMAQVLAAVPSAGLEAVLVAVDLVVESGALSALSALLVALGAGAALSSLVAAYPQVVWHSEHKEAVFSLAGLMMAGGGVFHWRNRHAPCPTDPALRHACLRTRKRSFAVHRLSATFYVIGGWAAFVQPWLWE